MRYLVFLVLCCSAAIQANENRYYCLHVKPNVDLTVTDAKLEWGKWIEAPGKNTEIGPPIGKVAPANGVLVICSTGRQMSTSGTTGQVRFVSPKQKTFAIWWSATWGGSIQHRSDENPSEFTITNRLLTYQQFEWKVIAL